MSTLKLSSNASGTGEFTIASPNSNTNRTFNLPDSSGTIATTESTLAQFNASGSAPVYAARAWANFNGTGTVAIRASGNVSSITDNGTGDYTVNFTTAMPDANYAITGSQGDTGSPNGAGMFAVNRVGSSGAASAPSTSACRVNTTNSAGNVLDNSYVNVSIFR